MIPIVEHRRGDIIKPPDYYRLIAPNQLLWIKDKRLTLYDVTKATELWSVALPAPEAKKEVKKAKKTGLAALAAFAAKARGEGEGEGEPGAENFED